MEIIKISKRPELLDTAAQWFHEKWHIPLEAYRESMYEALSGSAVPEWYIAVENNDIIGGLGVIENDFHNRKDLHPNVCAVYVEEAFRCRGIAGMLLNYSCEDMFTKGIDTLYLLTDHTGFYERYGWEFLCMVLGDGEYEMSRMYIHSYKEK
ncbi:MAG: GNAT family N-acetyltransferase [Oscillospiraceae bacterium]|nr:GNAT family N-acetyltransferase [Oscillospiraceae bacterium]